MDSLGYLSRPNPALPSLPQGPPQEAQWLTSPVCPDSMPAPRRVIPGGIRRGRGPARAFEQTLATNE